MSWFTQACDTLLLNGRAQLIAFRFESAAESRGRQRSEAVASQFAFRGSK